MDGAFGETGRAPETDPDAAGAPAVAGKVAGPVIPPLVCGEGDSVGVGGWLGGKAIFQPSIVGLPVMLFPGAATALIPANEGIRNAAPSQAAGVPKPISAASLNVTTSESRPPILNGVVRSWVLSPAVVAPFQVTSLIPALHPARG
jgi:hypothetical protein